MGEELREKRQTSESKGIKTNGVTFHFSNMADEILQERERIIHTFSNVPPQPFQVGDIVIVQPSEREIYLKQIELLERTPCLLGYDSVDEYIFRKQYKEANDLDDIRLEEYGIHIYDKTQTLFLKWSEGSDGAGRLKEESLLETKIEKWTVCKKLRHQVQLWTKCMEIKCFHKERERWGRDRSTKISIKTLMAIGLVGIQMPQKITYVEQGTSPRWGAGYKIKYEFKEKVPRNIRETLPVLFLRHVMQQAVILEEEHGPDIGYSDYKIRRSQYHLEVKSLQI